MALLFWAVLGDIYPETEKQHCWVRKIANVLDKLPKRLHPRAKSHLHEIMNAQDRETALEELTRFQDEYPKMVDCLTKDVDRLFTFMNYQTAHWVHMRTTNAIESTFATVKAWTRVTKGTGSRDAGLALAFKLLTQAKGRWRRVNSPHLVALESAIHNILQYLGVVTICSKSFKEIPMSLQAVAFDLDGVITNTAEFHYQAWQQLADEEELPFNRAINEKLRGIPRRESLKLILNERLESEERIQEMMARKNRHYLAKLKNITPADLLPGVADLFKQLDEIDIPYAIASASKNASAVCFKLGIVDRLAAIADGNSVIRQKPHPDLFYYTAVQLNVPTSQCLIVEDAVAGIEAAFAAKMPVLAIGPEHRFASILADKGQFPRRDNLVDSTVVDLQAALSFFEGYVYKG